MIARLYRVELFKLRKRLSSVAVWLTQFVLLLFIYGSYAYAAWCYPEASFEFPSAWPRIFESGAVVSSIMTGVLIVLLIGSEFEWRVVRQNLLDGVRRDEWFAARVLLLATLALLFLGTQLIFACALAALGTPDFSPAAMEPGLVQAAACAGFLLSVMLYGSFALWFAMMLRNTAAALALTLIYPVFDNIAARVLRGYEFHDAADLLLLQVMAALSDYDTYQTAASALAPEPGRWDSLPLLFGAGLAWALVLLGSAAWSFRMRDV